MRLRHPLDIEMAHQPGQGAHIAMLCPTTTVMLLTDPPMPASLSPQIGGMFKPAPETDYEHAKGLLTHLGLTVSSDVDQS